MRKLTTPEFIARSNKVHKNSYGYYKVNYVNSSAKVIIKCKIHGEFLQIPDHHLRGRGCPKCGGTKKLTTEEFVNTATKLHHNKYNYSKFVYVNNKTKSIIICPVHGKFLQNSNEHLTGYGCTKCGRETMGSKYRKKLPEFVKEANNVHRNKYDYSKVVYLKNSKKVIIVCPLHGEFSQAPVVHIAQKQGCPKCRSSKGERAIENFLQTFFIEYISQKTFTDCRSSNGRLLKFDFYIPSKNLLIEFDGEQHFIHSRFGTHYITKEEMRKIQSRDKLKNQYAKSHSITLLRIKYTESKEIVKILKLAFDFL